MELTRAEQFLAHGQAIFSLVVLLGALFWMWWGYATRGRNVPMRYRVGYLVLAIGASALIAGLIARILGVLIARA